MEEKIIRPTTKPEAIKGKLLKYQGTFSLGEDRLHLKNENKF